MDPEHVPYCDWVEIQGEAEGNSNYGSISGTITRHRSDPMHQWKEAIVLQRGRWIQGVESVSSEAVPDYSCSAFQGRACRFSAWEKTALAEGPPKPPRLQLEQGEMEKWGGSAVSMRCDASLPTGPGIPFRMTDRQF